MHKQPKSYFHYAAVLSFLWQSFGLNASQPFKDEHKEDKASSIIFKLPSCIDTRQALPSHNSSSQSQLYPDNIDLPHSIKKHQDDLQAVILKSLQARADTLSPLVVYMKEALASLPDASKRVLRQREAFLLDPSLSSFSPFGFLRRKDKLLTEVTLNPQHLSFERLREVIAHLDTLTKNEENILSPSLTSSLQQLKSVYETFIADLCSLSVDKRSSFLSSIPIDGEFFGESFVIAQEQAYDLLSFDEYGIPFKNNLLGSSVVTKVGSIHAKSTLIRANQEGTLDPGMEWAVSSFHTMLFGGGMVPSSLLILRGVPHQVALTNTEAERLVREAQDPNISRMDKKKILDRLHEDESLKNQFQRTAQSFAVQVTPHSEGIHLATFLEDAMKDPSLWDTLDLYNVQSLLLTALLTAPNDAKGDNFMVKREKVIENDGSIKVKHKIIGIDNDRAFYSYIKAFTPQAHLIDIRHILFCFPQVMALPLIQQVKDDFLSHHPALFLLNWLKVLNHHNDQYQTLLTEGRIPQALFNTLHLPLKLKQGTAISLFKKYSTLYDTLKLNHKSYITPDQLLSTLSPLTAQYYTTLMQAHGSLKAFDLIYRQTHTLEEVLEEKNSNNHKSQALSTIKDQELFVQNVTHEGLHNFTVLSKEDGSHMAHIEQEEAIHQAIINVLDTLELQALIPPIRKQVLEEVFISMPELVSQAKNAQWQSPYLIHEGLKHKEALFSLSLLKVLIHRFPQSLTLLDEAQGYAPLHYALENGADASILEFLLRAGADSNQRTIPKVGSSLTPLDIACMKNKVDAFKVLVEHGAMQGSASLALRFYKSLLASPSPSPLSSFLTLISKHQELNWLLCLDHLLPSQGEGVMLKTISQEQRVILNTFRLLQPKSKMLLSDLTNKIIDTKGNIINVMPEGRHPVGKVSLPFHNLQISLYFKEYPELPGLEEAVASLMRMTFGFGAPYSELIKLEGKPVLVSQGIHGRTLKAVLKDNPSHLKTLDPYSTSSLILLSMLINPEDGKPDNYILEERPEGNRLIAIDNDHAFVKAVAKSKPSINLNWSSPVIQVKTILYCLDQMQDKVHPRAREQFLKLNVGEVLESWLRHLRALNAQYHELFTEPERVKYMKEKECYIGIPFQEGAIKELYQKMSRLQSLLHDKPHLTHLELLCQLEPYLGKRYKPAFESPLSVQARFDLIDKPFFSKDGKTITSSGHILSSMNIPLQESLLEAAKRDLTKDKDYRPNKALEELKAIKQENVEAILKEQGISKLNLTNLKGVKLEDNLSQVLKKIDFKSIPEVDQKALFELLKQRPFKALILKNAQALQNDFLKQHLSFEHLKELNLTGCLAITDDILPILAEKAPALESLNLSYLPKIKNFTKNLFFRHDYLIFPALLSLKLSECTGLEKVKVYAPLIEKLIANSCPKLKDLKVKSVSLAIVDLRCALELDDNWLSLFLKENSDLKTLKLEGCSKITSYSENSMNNTLNSETEKNSPIFIKWNDERYQNNQAIFQISYKIISPISLLNVVQLKAENLNFSNKEASALCNLVNLSVLNLRNNKIGIEGCRALSSHPTLTMLDLSSNNLSDQEIWSEFDNNTKIIALKPVNWISLNKQDIPSFLKNNLSKRVSLMIDDNRNNQATRQLEEALKENKTITALDVQQNITPFYGIGGYEYAYILENNSVLKHLRLNLALQLEEGDYRKIKEALNLNTTLITLEFGFFAGSTKQNCLRIFSSFDLMTSVKNTIDYKDFYMGPNELRKKLLETVKNTSDISTKN